MSRQDLFFANRKIIEDTMNNEELLAHISTLTENQRALMEEIATLRARPVVDPFSYYKTPDPIKNLPTFSGDKRETLAFIQEVEETLELFESSKGEPIYAHIIRAVKGKINGEAKAIVIAAGNPTNWDDIKEVLLNSYGDKRDLTSHIQSLFYTTIGKNSLTEYYNKIKRIDTAVKSTANSTQEFLGATRQINAFVELISTTRFIDGLDEKLSMIIRSHKPKSLEEAFSYATQYSNASHRQKIYQKPNDFRKYPLPDKNSQPQPSTSKNFNSSSGKFRQKPASGNFKSARTNDGDVSMRTQRSNTNFQIPEEAEKTNENQQTLMDSDDDGYFVSDELNFHMAAGNASKT